MAHLRVWKAVRRALQRGVKAVAAGADRFRPTSPGVCVLIYHRVGAGTSSEVDLPSSLFEEQMALLAADHHVVSLTHALAILSGEAPQGDAGANTVAVTFDDGTEDFVEHALPVLARHGIPVCLYAATHYIDAGDAFPWGARPLSWQALSDASSTGLVEVGSHTHRHLLLDRLPPDQVADELDRSTALLEQHLQRPARHFAYPKAVPPSAGADAAVRARFASAALAGTRVNPYGDTDPHRLRRSPVQRGDAMRYFERKASGGMALEDDLRYLANRRRYRRSTT